jgi:hypothetical protein
MTDSALNYLNKSGGLSSAPNPSLVVVAKASARSSRPPPLRDDVYAFIFSQKGLWGGIGLQARRSRASILTDIRALAGDPPRVRSAGG